MSDKNLNIRVKRVEAGDCHPEMHFGELSAATSDQSVHDLHSTRRSLCVVLKIVIVMTRVYELACSIKQA